eukprot:3195478-Rhodomonas_salina.1
MLAPARALASTPGGPGTVIRDVSTRLRIPGAKRHYRSSRIGRVAAKQTSSVSLAVSDCLPCSSLNLVAAHPQLVLDMA